MGKVSKSEHLERLEKLWLAHYEEAKNYKAKYGDLEIPEQYIDPTGFKLGKWLGTQRLKYKDGKLPEHREDLLNQLDIIWNIDVYRWERIYKMAESYYHTHGNLIVKESYVCPEGETLGKWLSIQRKMRKRDKLYQWQIDKLDNISMIWNRLDYQWNLYYELAQGYYKTHGNLLVSVNYVDEGTGLKLGSWVANQRRIYKANKLNPERRQLLEKLNMVWVIKVL